MIDKLLTAIYRLTRRRAYWVIAFLVGLSLLSLLYVLSDFKVKSSFLDLLPQNDPLIKEYRRREKAVSDAQYLTVVISLKEGAEVSQKEGERILLNAAQKISSDLKGDSEIVEATYRENIPVPDKYSFVYALEEKDLQLLDRYKRELEGLEGGAEGPGEGSVESWEELAGEVEEKIKEFKAGNYKPEELDQLLQNFRAVQSGLRQGVQSLPQLVGLNEELGQTLEKIKGEDQRMERRSSRPLFSPDRRTLLINARPREPASAGVSYCREVTEVARSMAERIESDPRVSSGLIEVGLTGPYVTSADSDRALRSDMVLTTFISSVGIVLLFFLAFGSPFYSLLVIVPLCMVVSLTLGWAKFSVGGLNLLTSFLPSLVIGLGIDYGIHLLVRFSEERGAGRRVSRALERTIKGKGRGTLMAALTTSLVFISLLFSRSRGFVEMGIITSVSMFCSFFVYILVLPSLLAIYGRWTRGRSRSQLIDYEGKMRRWVEWVLRHRLAVIFFTVLITSLAFVGASRLDFRFSGADLSPRVESVALSEEVERKFGSQEFSSGPVFLFFPDSEEKLLRIKEELEGVELVKGVSSIARYLPQDIERKAEIMTYFANLEEEKARLRYLRNVLREWQANLAQMEDLIGKLSTLQFSSTLTSRGDLVKKISGGISELATTRKELVSIPPAKREEWSEALGELETRLEKVERESEALGQALTGPARLGELTKLLPPALLSTFTTTEGEYVLFARLRQEIYQGDNLNRFIDKVSSFSSDFFGVPLIRHRLESYLKRDFWIATSLALLVIVGVLALGVGGLRESALTVLPLFLGYVWMLGGMKLFGMNFNIVNIVISPLLIGIGVDNGLHLIYRWREERGIGRVVRAFSHTGLAVVTTSLTTIAVFGSLLVARTPGLRILGMTALMGVGFTMLASMTSLPASISLALGQGEEYNSPHDDY